MKEIICAKSVIIAMKNEIDISLAYWRNKLEDSSFYDNAHKIELVKNQIERLKENYNKLEKALHILSD